jgi:hypothetical protein
MPLAEIPPAVIDLEASGFGRGSYPIEVGFVLPDGTSYCSLIMPAPHWTHWDDEAERLHHITRQQLAWYGARPQDVATILNQRLRGRVVYSDGWAHDYSWLALLFDEAGLAPAFKLENLRTVLDENEVGLWHATNQSVRAASGLQRHRASADARLIQDTLLRIKQRDHAIA